MVAVLSCLLVAVVIGSISIYSTIKSSEETVNQLEKALRDSFDRTIRWEVETVVSMLDSIHNQEAAGKITLAEAKRQGADLVRSLSYDKDGYFWVDTSSGENVVFLGRDIEGRSRIDEKDIEGKEYVKETIEKAMQKGGGYTDFIYPKNFGSEPLPKRGYSLYYKPFDWVIGTGSYVNDIDAMVKAEREKSWNTMKGSLVMIVGGLLAALIAAIVLATVLGKRMTKAVNILSKSAIVIGEADLTGEDITVDTHDELSLLAQSFNNMKNNLKEVGKRINEIGYNVFFAVNDLNKTMKQNFEVSDQLSAVIQQVAKDAETQMLEVNNMSNAVEGSFDKLTHVTGKFEHISVMAEEVHKAVSGLQGGMGTGEESGEALRSTEKLCGGLKEEARDALEAVRVLQLNISKMNEARKTVVETTGQFAVSSEELAASVEEQNLNFKNIMDTFAKMTENVRELEEQVHKLKIFKQNA